MWQPTKVYFLTSSIIVLNHVVEGYSQMVMIQMRHQKHLYFAYNI